MSFMCHLFLESMWQQEKVYNFTLFSCILSCQTLSSFTYKVEFDFDFFTLAVSQDNFEYFYTSKNEGLSNPELMECNMYDVNIWRILSRIINTIRNHIQALDKALSTYSLFWMRSKNYSIKPKCDGWLSSTLQFEAQNS